MKFGPPCTVSVQVKYSSYIFSSAKKSNFNEHVEHYCILSICDAYPRFIPIKKIEDQFTTQTDIKISASRMQNRSDFERIASNSQDIDSIPASSIPRFWGPPFQHRHWGRLFSLRAILRKGSLYWTVRRYQDSEKKKSRGTARKEGFATHNYRLEQ